MDKSAKKLLASPDEAWSPSSGDHAARSSFEHSDARKKSIARLESLRESKVLVLVDNAASSPQGFFRHLFEHLRSFRGRSHERLSVVILRDDARGQARTDELDFALRVSALIREYAREFEVLIPGRAYGAATMLAMSADRVLMHALASLGRIPGADLLADLKHFQALCLEEDFSGGATARFVEAVGPEELGRRHHRAACLRTGLQRLTQMRIQPRQEGNLQSLEDALDDPTCPLARSIDRRAAKDLLGLSVEGMDADTEAALWDLLCAYEGPLSLLDVRNYKRIPVTVLESSQYCHAFYPAEEDRGASGGWVAVRPSFAH